MADKAQPYRVLSGLCPDQQCQAKLFFPAHESSIECTQCGQRHEQKSLQNVQRVTNPEVALHNMLRNVLLGNIKLQRGTDSVKVLGLSNYECKLLSPILTHYGMDKATGKAKLLTEMGQSSIFDCGILGDRAFRIEQEHIDTVGYGRDKTGSAKYLENTLEAIKKANNNEERLVPIHTDGDGHCLVHALSRALIGRELFWHALRENLKSHFIERLETYRALFNEFIDRDEWQDIIRECDPFFTPKDGEALGLRNIHIFGLANVLRRPIILLDSLSGMQSSGDYSGVFLPALTEVEQCKGKDGSLNKPLCLAWSSMGRNHYIALIGVRGRECPRLPRWMFPRVWGPGMPSAEQYVQFDSNGSCVIGGEKALQDKYIIRLADAMNTVFQDKYRVSPSLVADVHHYIYRSTGIVGLRQDVIIENTQKAVSEGRLYRCLTCEAVAELKFAPDWLRNGGALYALAERVHGRLQRGKNYSFTQQGLVCQYDPRSDELIPDYKLSKIQQCSRCQGSQMRPIKGDGCIVYENGDRTTTRVEKSRCKCGFKHYWDGKEYDNLPEIFPITLEWAGKVEQERVTWFQYESDESMNSNVFKVAQNLVEKHFPGEFGSERLVQNVVDKILAQTARSRLRSQVSTDSSASPSSSNQQPRGAVFSLGDREAIETADDSNLSTSWQPDSPSKIILKGLAQTTVHKEELTASEKEKSVQKKIAEKAPQQQKRKTMELQRKQAASSPVKASTSSKQPKTTPESVQSSDSADGQGSKSDSAASSGETSEPITGGAARSEKKIRISTSDGRHVMLSLELSITYASLREHIQKELNIPLNRQKIRHGFPPRELKPPEEGKEGEPLPLQHGDRVNVEILPDPDAAVPSASVSQPWPAQKTSKSTWSGFDSEAKDVSAAHILKGLTQLQDNSGDSLDAAIGSMALMATLMGKDLWTYVQAEPHLFSVGGLLYQQVQRDLGLSDGKHCTLPSLPGKVFRYNAQEDRLELCLEPYGHFQVEPGIEDRILHGQSSSHSSLTDLHQKAQGLRDILSSGSAGIEVDKVMNMPGRHQGAQQLFPGQGHSMVSSQNSGAGKEDTRMPQELTPPSHHKNKATRLKEFSHNTPHPDTIAEEGEGMETDSPVSMPTLHSDLTTTINPSSPLFKRIGPGSTVLNQDVTNSFNRTSEMLQALTSNIQSIAEEKETDEECMESEVSEGLRQDDLQAEKTSQACCSQSDNLPEEGSTALSSSNQDDAVPGSSSGDAAQSSHPSVGHDQEMKTESGELSPVVSEQKNETEGNIELEDDLAKSEDQVHMKPQDEADGKKEVPMEDS